MGALSRKGHSLPHKHGKQMGGKGPGEQAPRRFSSSSARLQSLYVLLPPQIVLGHSSQRATIAQTQGSKVASQLRPVNSCVAVCVLNSSHSGLWVICTETPAVTHCLALCDILLLACFMPASPEHRVLGTVPCLLQMLPIAGFFQGVILPSQNLQCVGCSLSGK